MAQVCARNPRKMIVGMIHVGALPGTPRAERSLPANITQAVAEARIYLEHGLDALLIENMHDVPYLRGAVGPEIVAGMTAVGVAVRGVTTLPLGVQILAAANREALAVAQACGAEYVRVENFAYAHVADEGLMAEAEAGPLLRYRRAIGAESIAVIADVKKKHSSHALTADVDLAEAARTTEFFGAAGIIVTGAATATPTAEADVRAVRTAVEIPVWIGSGVTPETLPGLWPLADVFVVGSFFKESGHWAQAVDPRRVAMLMAAVGRLRGS
ncbi:MAG: BtpA/SgcQ family protein [Phycisphaerales bacterium]|nr:BtpA/SgcQ family protein [Phycisphaerales bacterium]